MRRAVPVLLALVLFPGGPFGAKGCGEGAFAGVIGAIATAVADAGVPVNALPLTPERVWRSMHQASQEEVGS